MGEERGRGRRRGKRWREKGGRGERESEERVTAGSPEWCTQRPSRVSIWMAQGQNQKPRHSCQLSPVAAPREGQSQSSAPAKPEPRRRNTVGPNKDTRWAHHTHCNSSGTGLGLGQSRSPPRPEPIQAQQAPLFSGLPLAFPPRMRSQ